MTRMASRRPYHHGDLKQALVTAAIDLLETTSASELSLREVARKAGVTTGAPYHHFKTKADLLAEVACLGFEALGRELSSVDGARATARERLERRVEAYIRFAVAHGAHYRVMFAPELRESTELARYEMLSRAGFDGLVRAVEGVRPELRGKAARAVARTIWAAAHGFALLALDGTIDALEDTRRQHETIRSTAKHLVSIVTAA